MQRLERMHRADACSPCSTSGSTSAGPVSLRRGPRRCRTAPVHAESKPKAGLTSSRASEATALSQQFKSKSNASCQYDYLQYLDTESRISVQIASAQSIAELNTILTTGNYADSLHNSHVAAIVSSMPRALDDQLIGQTERLSVQRMLKQLNTLASMYLHRFQPLEIVDMLDGWAKLRALDTRLQAADPILASLLIDLLCDSLSTLSPQQLATAVWAIGALEVPVQGPALSALLTAIRSQLPRLTPEDHIRLASGLVHIGCPLPRAWAFDWQLRTAELPALPAHQAATMLAIAAQLPVFEHGDAPEWIDSMLAKTRGGLAGLPLPVLVDTLTAVAKLAHPGSVPEPWLAEFLAAVASALFVPSGDVRGGAAAVAAGGFALPVVPAVRPVELAALAAALGTLGLQPGAVWMAAFLRVVGVKLPAFSAEELAGLVWGLALLDCRPEEGWLQQVAAEAECRVADFDLSQASKVTWALGMMSCP